MSSRRSWTYSVSAVKLICKFFLTNKNYKTTCLVILISPKLTNTAVVRLAFEIEHSVLSPTRNPFSKQQNEN
jgi:hypothetical protein